VHTAETPVRNYVWKKEREYEAAMDTVEMSWDGVLRFKTRA